MQAGLRAVGAPALVRVDLKRPSVGGGGIGRKGGLGLVGPAQSKTTRGGGTPGRRDLRRLAYFHHEPSVTPFVVELRNIPFEQQRQILFYIVDRLPRFRAGKLDARGNGQFLAEVAMQRYGATRIEQVMLTAEWYRANMPPYKAAFEDDTI